MPARPRAGRAAGTANISGVLCRNRLGNKIKNWGTVTASGSLNVRISLNYDIDKCPHEKEKAGWGCVGRFFQLFAGSAARPALGLAGGVLGDFGYGLL